MIRAPRILGLCAMTCAAAACDGFDEGPGAAAAGDAGLRPALELCDVINAHRASRGLVEVPISPALMRVAELHVADLSAHPEITADDCNLHSWSEGDPRWTGCCYTPDHAQRACMWSKPGEITADWGQDRYPGSGFEISVSGVRTPARALEVWEGSPGHHDVILNAGRWSTRSPWLAMGCALGGGYGAVWFGGERDPRSP